MRNTQYMITIDVLDERGKKIFKEISVEIHPRWADLKDVFVDQMVKAAKNVAEIASKPQQER